MATDYYVRTTGRGRPYAEIFSHDGGSTVAELDRRTDGSFSLVDLRERRRKLHLTRKVDGEIRPFSILVLDERDGQSKIVLKIRDRLFFFDNNKYILSNVPRGKGTHHFESGPKNISRLENFDYDDPSKVDPETRSRAERRLRGKHVGEISGIGTSPSGHHVRLEDESLRPIGVPLAAASFVINTTGYLGFEGQMREK